MDRNIIAIGHAYADQEAAVAVACYSAAAFHGLSNMQADTCEGANRACPACPFKTQDDDATPAHHNPSNLVLTSSALDAMPGMADSRGFWVFGQSMTNGASGK